jgi:aminopeptidase N
MIAACLLLAMVPQTPTPEPGISRSLAEARRELIGGVRYLLRFGLEPGAKSVDGEVWLHFELDGDHAPAAPVVLDFAGTDLAGVRINDKDAAPQAVAGHLVLPVESLVAGVNGFRARFRSPVAATGTPLTVYRDPADGREYWYTLVVPADAHRLYPCFDQPDLKARFHVELDLPPDWVAVANGAEEPDPEPAPAGRRRWSFRETKPLPTYLMAFACGPFGVVPGPPLQVGGVEAGAPLRLFVRPSQRHLVDREALVQLHGTGLRWLRDYFGIDYPFGKLDVVLLPGFPYGGMEHAGAIFYREQALVFDHPPTDAELARRSALIYHELSHQWFGNLVTMRWFDDLWLKEGFATFVGYQAMAALEPGRQAWLRFLQRVKPRAYEVDGTPGTTPVFQELKNLADAKSAYGAIVYNKAPAVLRELHERLGAAAFQSGLRRFLEQHAYGNATWQDLAGALEAASRTDLGRWSERWLLSPSMPRVRVQWAADGAGVVLSAALTQEPALGSGTWPLRLELLVFDRDGGRRRLDVSSDEGQVPVEELVGGPAPACVIANPGDVAYGQFVPDPASRDYMLAHAAAQDDPLLRAVMVSALFESVREAELDPDRFCATLLDVLRKERDPDTHGWLLGPLAACLSRYLTGGRAASRSAEASRLLMDQLQHEGGSGRELQTFRFLAWHGSGPEALALCRAVAARQPLPAGLEPGKEDRFLAAAALLAAGEGREAIADLLRHYADQDVGKEAFLAGAAAPSAEAKADYWRQYLQLDAPPEQWSQDSLAWFHWPGQDALTLPWLAKALEKALWVKENRRIFFMPAWIDAFVNGHSDGEALRIVDAFLAAANLPPDVRQKMLQSRDGLRRAVRIRAAFGGSGR